MRGRGKRDSAPENINLAGATFFLTLAASGLVWCLRGAVAGEAVLFSGLLLTILATTLRSSR